MKITPEQESLIRAEFKVQEEADRFLEVVRLLCPECKDDKGGLLKDGVCQECGYKEK